MHLDCPAIFACVHAACATGELRAGLTATPPATSRPSIVTVVATALRIAGPLRLVGPLPGPWSPPRTTHLRHSHQRSTGPKSRPALVPSGHGNQGGWGHRPAEIGARAAPDPSNLWGNARGGSDGDEARGS